MKFAQLWRKRRSLLPEVLHDRCLDYKKYKKLSNQTQICKEIVKATLATDLEAIDSVFRHAIKGRRHKNKKHLFLPCCQTVENLFSAAIIVDFASLNMKCFYKVCKRLDKRLGTPTFMDFYSKQSSGKSYAFMSRMQHVMLSLDTEATDEECPVCFEALKNLPSFFVLKCGHMMCKACVMSMLGVEKLRGTTENLIKYGVYTNKRQAACPLCRDPAALQAYKAIASCHTN